MDYTQQEFSIDDDIKNMSLKIYKKSVKIFVHKDYVRLYSNTHLELSAIFGFWWMTANSSNDRESFNSSMCAQINYAFNYAHMHHRKKSKFIELAKKLVVDAERVSDPELKAIASQMNYLLVISKEDA